MKDHEVLKLANWQNIAHIYKRRIASEMYKVVHSPASHRLQDLFKIVDTRTKGKQLQIKRTNTELGTNSLFFRRPVVWNRLQREIREQKTLDIRAPKSSQNNKTYYCLTKISIRAKRSISRVFSLFIVPSPFFVHCPYKGRINRAESVLTGLKPY